MVSQMDGVAAGAGAAAGASTLILIGIAGVALVVSCAAAENVAAGCLSGASAAWMETTKDGIAKARTTASNACVNFMRIGAFSYEKGINKIGHTVVAITFLRADRRRWFSGWRGRMWCRWVRRVWAGCGA